MYKYEKEKKWGTVYLVVVTGLLFGSILANVIQDGNYNKVSKQRDSYKEALKVAEIPQTVYLADEQRAVNIDELHSLYTGLKEEYSELYEESK